MRPFKDYNRRLFLKYKIIIHLNYIMVLHFLFRGSDPASVRKSRYVLTKPDIGLIIVLQWISSDCNREPLRIG